LHDLLLDEIADIRGILRRVAIGVSHVGLFFGGLAEAVRRAAEDNLKELEDIEQHEVAALKSTSREDPLYRKLYTQTAQRIHLVRSRAVMLNELTELMFLSASRASQDSSVATALRALKTFIDDAVDVLKDLSGVYVHVLMEYAYTSLDILMDGYGVYVVNIPSYDLFNPWKWILLLHELGHAAFEARKDEYTRMFRSHILPLLRSLAPRGVEGRYDVLFEKYWLEELVADLYGVSIGGPAFTSAFIVEAFGWNPSVYTTHPPLDSRMGVQLRYLKEASEHSIGEHVRILERKWFQHRRSLDVEEPGYPFSKEVLGEVVKIFREVTGPPPFLSYADEVLSAVEALNSGRTPEGRPLALVAALALSDRGRAEALQRGVIEALSKL